MFYHLLKACHNKHVSILLVGDKNQLPSVGYGDIFNSLIKSNKIPVISLQTIYRQSQGSTISLLSKYVVQGVVPGMDILNDGKETFYYRCSSVSSVIDKVKELYTLYKDDAIVISPMRKGPLGTVCLNNALHDRQLGETVITTRQFLPKERVIIVSNMYSKSDDGEIDLESSAFNGDIGHFLQEDAELSMIEVLLQKGKNLTKSVWVEKNSVDFGHSCTVHKMQGAEQAVVILVIHTHHGRMLNKRLLYTAITRAKKNLYIIGCDQAIVQATQKDADERYDLLSHLL